MLYDRAVLLTQVVAVLLLPAYLTLVLRCYVRVKRKAFGHDDYCMLVAGVFFAWLSYEMIYGATLGIGAHQQHFKSIGDEIKALKHLFLIEISFAFCVLWIKLGIAFMLLRVANNPIHIWIIRSVTIVYVLFSLAVDFYVVLECKPIAFNWDPTIPGGRCGPVGIVVKLTYAITALNIFTDWFCVLMPVIVLWNLQMNFNTKVVSVVLLGLGVFTSVCSLIRMDLTSLFSEPEDHLYKSAIIMVWSFAEAGVGMITANSSVLRPLLSRFFNTSTSDKPTPAYRPSYSSKPYQLGRLRSPFTLGSLRSGFADTKATTLIDTQSGITLTAVDKDDNKKSCGSTTSSRPVISDDDASDRVILGEYAEVHGKV